MKRIRLIQALEKLKTFNDIQKEKIYLDKDSDVDISTSKIMADVMGVELESKRKFTTLYSLTKQGISKLCYYEHYYGMHQLWTPPGFEGMYQDNYERGIAKRIVDQAFYKRKKGLA